MNESMYLILNMGIFHASHVIFLRIVIANDLICRIIQGKKTETKEISPVLSFTMWLDSTSKIHFRRRHIFV